jgi:hypothetical protein
MAYINIDLRLSTINSLNASTGGNPANLSQAASVFSQAANSFAANHSYTANADFGGSSVRIEYPDGAYTNIYSVILVDPTAKVGEATARGVENYQPNAYRLTQDGILHYHYSLINGVATIAGTSSTITAAQLETLLPSSSPNYDPVLGNVTLNMAGSVTTAANGQLSGYIDTISSASAALGVSTSMTGNLTVSGNANSIAQGLSTVGLQGTVDSYAEYYADGSIYNLTHLGLKVDGNTVISEKMLEDGNNLPGNDFINVTLATALSTPWALASGAGNDDIRLTGGGATLSVNAGSGNDSIALGDSGHRVDGGSGVDMVVFSGARSTYTVIKSDTGYTVQAKALGGGADTLANVERLQFADATVALDSEGTGIGGQAYRLYQAAFNRTPDASGLGFWIHYMDGGMSLNEVADFFITSPEFETLYGANLSNADMIDKLYQNVLHRAGDTGGIAFWTDYLEHGGGTQAKMLAFFGESPENQAALIGTIANGFTYTPYG